MKKTQSEIKLIKIRKQSGTTYCLECKDFTHNFRPQEVKMTNKVLREKPNFVVSWSNKSKFLKKRKTQQQKIIQRFTGYFYKNKMKTYCVKCRKDTEKIDPQKVKTKNNRLIMQSKCPVCGIKKPRFGKEQEAKGLLSNSGIKTPWSKIPPLNVLL